jgi:hypothetical protein
MATVQFRPNSLLGILFAAGSKTHPAKVRSGPSALRRLAVALALVLGPLLVPATALTAITIGAWQWSPVAGWVVLGISLLWLDATAGNSRSKR